jgi:hypothetical protein
VITFVLPEAEQLTTAAILQLESRQFSATLGAKQLGIKNDGIHRLVLSRRRYTIAHLFQQLFRRWLYFI